MAFGITRYELLAWKERVNKGEIAFMTHYWYDERFPQCNTVTKVGCVNLGKLIEWGKKYQLQPSWIDTRNDYPHFDLLGEKQIEILKKENQWSQMERFFEETPT
ncbi:hypothetical protein [Alkalihalobacillus sp. 1P02AB]|uniref:hypothetical protein n=1 Tax=Alkalihalobacillus sp. 1P02AB TaxID=3132260 RepID=UPI0039A478D1